MKNTLKKECCRGTCIKVPGFGYFISECLMRVGNCLFLGTIRNLWHFYHCYYFVSRICGDLIQRLILNPEWDSGPVPALDHVSRHVYWHVAKDMKRRRKTRTVRVAWPFPGILSKRHERRRKKKTACRHRTCFAPFLKQTIRRYSTAFPRRPFVVNKTDL